MATAPPVLYLREMAQEPLIVSTTKKPNAAPNPYNGRWRWWYAAIADWMIANPGGSLKQCAQELNRGYNTICFIANSDMFKEYYARRRQEWQESHDFAIRNKLTHATELGLDILIEQMTSKRSQIPMAPLAKMVESSLDRLGFAPKSQPAAVVQINNENKTVVVQGVSAADLSDARDRLRAVEQAKTIEAPLGGGNQLGSPVEGEVEVEPPDTLVEVSESRSQVEVEADASPLLD